jgi:glycerophosphoryl diester phosphodiesterase
MTPSPWPLWIAHRGAGKLAPENTLAAFRVGAQHGYAAFECDVKLSADGVPFLLHDATLDRTSNAQGTAGDKPWAELSRVDAGAWHSRAYAGEPLPTLDAIAAYCHANGHALNIEIKPTPGVERRTGEVVAREAQRLWSGRTTAPLMSSFEPAALEGAREAAPQLPRALLIDTLVEGWFERAQALGCVAVVANHRLFNRERVERLHGAGLWALCYTVNDESSARALLGVGLDGLITDAVDRFSPHAGRLGV